MIQTAPAQDVEQLGKFELLEQIGHGGMATVHRALLRGMGGFERQIVIKRILPELASDEHFVKMFIDEAKLSAQLEHPNIVQIYDFGVVDNTYYLAMEFLDGVTLLNFIKKHGRREPIPPAAAAFVIHQVCLGLDYAHQLQRDGRNLGLVHRDVSPANVMLTTHGGVKLLDFGIAKAVEAIEREDTRTGTLKGKWSYMSPEQVEGKEITARSDIFATGIMLWEMLTCRRLFKAKTDFLTLSNVVRAKVPPVTSFRPEVPPLFDRVCAKALARDPDDRYQSAEEMSDALEEILSISHFTASQLSDLVRPRLDDSLPPENEPSGSKSTSLSGSAVGFVPTESGEESVSSLAKGEAASFSPLERPRGRGWVLPAIIGGGLMALVTVITTLAIALSGDDPSDAPPSTKRPVALAQCTVRVVSTPKGADVRVEDETTIRGITPLTLKFPCAARKKTIRIALAGHEERVEKVQLSAGGTLVKVPLEERVVIEPGPKPDGAVGKPDAKVEKPDAKKPDVKKPDVKKPAVKKPGVKKPAVKRPSVKRPDKKPDKKPGKKPGKKVPDLKSGGLADPYGS